MAASIPEQKLANVILCHEVTLLKPKYIPVQSSTLGQDCMAVIAGEL